MCLIRLGRGGERDERWSVYLTGHSMGGALATLCAYELAVCLAPHPTVRLCRLVQPTLPCPFFRTETGVRSGVCLHCQGLLTALQRRDEQ